MYQYNAPNTFLLIKNNELILVNKENTNLFGSSFNKN